MVVRLAKRSIDFGIVITNSDASLAFYCGLLGLEHRNDIPLPGEWSGVMHIVVCGDSLIKLVRLSDPPDGRPVEATRLEAATGYRYWTILVKNLDEILEACRAAKVTLAIPTVTVPETGGRFTLITDPDGNLVELLEFPEHRAEP